MAHDREDLLKRYLPEDIIKNAQSYMGNISVLKEGRIASDFGVHGMHDATEGGILGAIWETSEAMGKGVEIQIAKIPVAPETKAICSFLYRSVKTDIKRLYGYSFSKRPGSC